MDGLDRVLPTVGDYIAVGFWLLFFGTLAWGFVQQLRVEQRRRDRRRHDARYPVANRYQRAGWRP